jgi:sporulation protein YlmC with PRC-barrel domain
MVRRTFVGLACGILLGSVLSGPAVAAQQGSSERSSRTDLDEIRMVSALLKTEVMNRANEKIATVSDLILTADGKVHYAILGVGGVVGIGTKYTAIPWSKLEAKHLHGKYAVNLDMSKDRLDQAPMLQDENYNELNNPQWIARMREFFGARDAGSTAHETSAESTSGAAQTKMLRASKIMAAALKNSRDESLGKVEDLLLDKGSRVAFAIIGHGGVLGIGESYIPVPWSKLRFTHLPDSNSLVAVLDMNKDQLEKAPLVRGSTYETMLAPGFTSQVYRFFGVEGRE